MFLVQFICPECGYEILWGLETMSVCCPKCHQWVTARNRKQTNPCKMIAKDVDEEMVLF